MVTTGVSRRTEDGAPKPSDNQVQTGLKDSHIIENKSKRELVFFIHIKTVSRLVFRFGDHMHFIKRALDVPRR